MKKLLILCAFIALGSFDSAHAQFYNAGFDYRPYDQGPVVNQNAETIEIGDCVLLKAVKKKWYDAMEIEKHSFLVSNSETGHRVAKLNVKTEDGLLVLVSPVNPTAQPHIARRREFKSNLQNKTKFESFKKIVLNSCSEGEAILKHVTFPKTKYWN